ncbi:unnamed protein product [Owenia fusiformis]|uniref:Uncharacterized protein n=1 Tax=Owenia fusiformis TaxID=6347 RepID=A0A8J1T7H5_OWEFU|nr:unnamed protein product [Owenia fusiformis]
MKTDMKFRIYFIIIISTCIILFMLAIRNTSNDVQVDTRSQKCQKLCTVKYDIAKGYPPVANSGLYGDYLCPTMFRDMSDYVFGWPFSHFHEVVNVPDLSEVLDCLPPVPILFSKGDPKIVRNFSKELGDYVKPGFILLTGQTDYPSPGKNKKLLDNPNILRWYGPNPGITHPKFHPFPLGLQCFEHAQGMLKFHNKYGENIKDKLQNNRKRMENGDLQKLAVLNFGETHPIRRTVKTQLCNEKHPYIECQNKLWTNNVTEENGRLSLLYESLSKYPFWVAPRGNGLDTHRIWEALYVGSIPIVQRSLLDPLFKDLPVLLIDNYEDLTEKQLKDTLIKFSEMDIDTKTLYKNYWRADIEKFRSEMIKKYNLADSARFRCWGT